MERREGKGRKRNKRKRGGREERQEGEEIEEREGEREGKEEYHFHQSQELHLYPHLKEQNCLDKLVQRYLKAGGVWVVQTVDYGCDSVYPLQYIANLQHL